MSLEFSTDEFKKVILKLMIDSSTDYYTYSSYITINMFPSFLKPIYKSIRSIREKYDGIINRGILEEELAKNVSKEVFESYDVVLSSIYNITIDDYDYIREIIEKNIKKERLIDAIIKASEKIKNNEDLDNIPALIEEALNIDTVTDFTVYKDLFSTKEEAKEDLKSRISTGLPSLDMCLKGGYGKQEVHVVLAGAKAGKTTFLIRTAVDILKQNKTVVHISFELKESLIKWKYVSSITGLSYDDVINEDYSAIVTKRLKLFEEKYSPNLVIKKFESGKVNTNKIKAFINNLIYKGVIDKPDIIIIDYDALLAPTKKYKDKYDSEGQKYIDMINLASYFDCSILVPSQTNREGWRKSEKGEIITSSDLAESATKKMHCDSIITLNRISDDRMILYVDTVRFGINNVEIDMKLELDRNRMYELKDGKPFLIFDNIEKFDDKFSIVNKKESIDEMAKRLNKQLEEAKDSIDFDF